MSLTPHQEQMLTETHSVSVTTKILLEVHMKELADTKERVTKLEKKINFFMGAWLTVSTIAGAVFAWALNKGSL